MAFMSELFVRLSVFWEDYQMDVSLPANRPIIDYLDDVVGLFQANVPTSDHQERFFQEAHLWVLSSTTTGVLPAHTTLAELSIEDGDQLFLSRREEAAQAPFVDDIMAEMRQTIGRSQWTWAGNTRKNGLLIAALSTALLGMLAALRRVFHAASTRSQAGFFSAAQANSISSPIVLTLLIGLGVFALTAVAVAAWQPRPWARWLGFTLPVVVGITGFLALTPLSGAVAVAFWAAIVSICTVPAIWLTARRRNIGRSNRSKLQDPSPLAGTITCILFALAAGFFGLATSLGASPLAIAAWGAWVPVLLLLLTPTIAIGSTGLAALLRRSDEGEPVAREQIKLTSMRTERVSRGITWFATAMAAGIVLTLGSSPYWQQGLIAGALSVLLLLRVSGFSDARIVTPLLVVGATGLALMVGSAIQWITQKQPVNPDSFITWWLGGSYAGWNCWLGALLMVGVAVAIQLALVATKPDELAEARWVKLMTVVDSVVCVAFIPLVLIGQGVLTYYWAVT